MTVVLTDLQKRLCNRLQEGLPICARPFAEIAKALGSTESEVLQQTRELLKAGLIRRLSVLLNHRALGIASALVTAHVPPEQLDHVADAVNALHGVSHNYLREHHYNLWFTLQEPTEADLDMTLRDLQARFRVAFHSLPVTRVFKLDVRFDLVAGEDLLTHDTYDVPGTEPVVLNPEQRQLIARLQDGIEVTARPFEILQIPGQTEEDLLCLLTELKDLGVLRRIAAVLNYRRLGYTVNVLFAAEVPPESVVEAGNRLAHFRAVSHCYERETFEGWPYNLFAMLHARTAERIEQSIREFTSVADVRSYALLPTAAELKKKPVRHKLA